MTSEFFQGFADLLAEEVQKELTLRGVPLLASDDKGIEPERYIGRDFVGYYGIYQVKTLVKWPEDATTIPAQVFLKEYLKKWAIEMGLKLARPGVLTTYAMLFPRGVAYAALGNASDLILRCIVNYSIHDDANVLRIDALAKWDE